VPNIHFIQEAPGDNYIDDILILLLQNLYNLDDDAIVMRGEKEQTDGARRVVVGCKFCTDAGRTVLARIHDVIAMNQSTS